MSNDLTSLRDGLAGALIGLARTTFGNEDLLTTDTFAVVLDGLSALDPGCKTSADQIEDLTRRVDTEKYKIVPNCFYCAAPCGRTSNYDMKELVCASAEVRSLKLSILSRLSSIAVLLKNDDSVVSSIEPKFYRALAVLGEDWSAAELSSMLMELERSL